MKDQGLAEMQVLFSFWLPKPNLLLSKTHSALTIRRTAPEPKVLPALTAAHLL
jgi:hypothetical protein